MVDNNSCIIIESVRILRSNLIAAIQYSIMEPQTVVGTSLGHFAETKNVISTITFFKQKEEREI